MTTDPFAPLDGAGASSAGADKAKRRAVMPIPADAPAPPASHASLGKPSRSWTYRDAAGAPIGFVHRFEAKDGKEFRPQVLFETEDGKRAWRWESWPAPRPLYGLDRLAARPAASVVVTEGEKASDAAGALLPAHVVVSSPNGSKSAGKADWSALKGRHVTIWPDADAPGLAFGEAVAECLRKAGAASVGIVTPPAGSAEGWDAADAQGEGWDTARAESLVSGATLAAEPPSEDKPAEEKAGKKRKRGPPQRDALMGLTDDCDLWCGEDGEAFVTFPRNGHRETWPVRSSAFKKWMAHQAFEGTGLVPGSQAVEDTLRVLEARATGEGVEQSPWLRVGERGGKFYLDLCDRDWRAVEISSTGWKVLTNHRLPFIRSPAMRPLPEPEAGESIDMLRNFVNVEGDDDFVMVVSWLVAALRSRGPYPILVVNGEQGSGKSTFSRLIRSIVDPNVAPIRAVPKDDRDLMVAVVNNHTIAFDNLSKVDIWLSDALCRVSTGGGFATRALHTDRDENVVMATRPIILNGIPSLTDRPDLSERSIGVRLKAIPDDERRPEDEFWTEWDKSLPFVLGALCDALSTACRRLPGLRLDRAPRLADFARLIVAAEPGLGWEEGAFITAYADNRRDQSDTTFEADPLAIALRNMMRGGTYPEGWHGTATELLTVLSDNVSETVKRSRAWPVTAQGLGNRIDRVAPLLRNKGVRIERRHSGVRTISITTYAP